MEVLRYPKAPPTLRPAPYPIKRVPAPPPIIIGPRVGSFPLSRLHASGVCIFHENLDTLCNPVCSSIESTRKKNKIAKTKVGERVGTEPQSCHGRRHKGQFLPMSTLSTYPPSATKCLQPRRHTMHLSTTKMLCRSRENFQAGRQWHFEQRLAWCGWTKKYNTHERERLTIKLDLTGKESAPNLNH